MSDDAAVAPTRRRYSKVQQDQAVGLVRQVREETGERHGAVQRVARQLGYGVETVRKWVNPELTRPTSTPARAVCDDGGERRSTSAHGLRSLRPEPAFGTRQWPVNDRGRSALISPGECGRADALDTCLATGRPPPVAAQMVVSRADPAIARDPAVLEVQSHGGSGPGAGDGPAGRQWVGLSGRLVEIDLTRRSMTPSPARHAHKRLPIG